MSDSPSRGKTRGTPASSDPHPDPSETLRVFYEEQVPADFNRTLADRREHARSNKEAARLVEEMEAVRTSIVVQVDGVTERARFVFDIERGVMSLANAPSHAPFMILGHPEEDFAALRRECGNSLLGFLGGLAGIGDKLLLTSQRVRSLRELHGSLVFERIGEGGFSLFAHFGVAAPQPEPQAIVRVDAQTYAQLQSGELDLQDAFLGGQIEVIGDEGMAIGLALAAASPD